MIAKEGSTPFAEKDYNSHPSLRYRLNYTKCTFCLSRGARLWMRFSAPRFFAADNTKCSFCKRGEGGRALREQLPCRPSARLIGRAQAPVERACGSCTTRALRSGSCPVAVSNAPRANLLQIPVHFGGNVCADFENAARSVPRLQDQGARVCGGFFLWSL